MERFTISLILISIILIPIVISASVSTDKTNYNPLETVYITGNGFQSGEPVLIEIYNQVSTDPIFHDSVFADSSGYISTNYIIPENARIERHDVYASAASLGGNPVSTYFNVLADTEKPKWSNFYIQPSVATTLDDVKINVTWWDDRNIGKVLIWENSTGIWVGHIFSG